MLVAANSVRAPSIAPAPSRASRPRRRPRPSRSRRRFPFPIPRRRRRRRRRVPRPSHHPAVRPSPTTGHDVPVRRGAGRPPRDARGARRARRRRRRARRARERARVRPPRAAPRGRGRIDALRRVRRRRARDRLHPLRRRVRGSRSRDDDDESAVDRGPGVVLGANRPVQRAEAAAAIPRRRRVRLGRVLYTGSHTTALAW